jgi:hypothetical protein
MLDDAKRVYEEVLRWEIESSDDYDKAATFLTEQVKPHRKNFEAYRDEFVKPLNQIIKETRAEFAPALKMLDDTERHIKSELKRYKEEAERKHVEMLTDAQTPEEVAAAVDVLADKHAGISERVVWRWEVTDESKIPDEYWVLDEARLNREVRAKKGDLGVPGVQPVQDKTLVVR